MNPLPRALCCAFALSLLAVVPAAQAGDSPAAAKPAEASRLVGVSDFSALPAADAGLSSSARALAALLPGELSKEKGIRVVESGQRSEILKEQALMEALSDGAERLDKPSGAIGTKTADVMVVGKLVQAGSARTMVLRAVTVASGEVIGAWSAPGDRDSMKAAASLAPEIARAVLAGPRAGNATVAIAASGPPESRERAEIAAELLSVALARAEGVRLMERSDLSGVLSEAAVAGGATKLAGVVHVVLVSGIPGNDDLVEVKVVEARTGQAVKTWTGGFREISRIGGEAASGLAKGF